MTLEAWELELMAWEIFKKDNFSKLFLNFLQILNKQVQWIDIPIFLQGVQSEEQGRWLSLCSEKVQR